MSSAEPQPIPDSLPRPVPPIEGMAPGTVSSWLDWAASTLEAESPSARADAEVLMSALLEVPRSQLRLRDQDSIPAARVLQFAGWVDRRRMGEPVAYLTGRQGFWTLDVDVNPAVLIPRADTETLVEWALQRARAVIAAPGDMVRVLDLGTGSGAIALSLAAELKVSTQIIATDRSDIALAVARGNARVLAAQNVEFRAGDWFAALTADDALFDLIVSNPPYIADGDSHLPDLRYEPRIALTSGADGLDAIRRIVIDAPAHLRCGSWLLLEHGQDQAASVRELLIQAGFEDVQTRRDFGGNDRVSGGRRP